MATTKTSSSKPDETKTSDPKPAQGDLTLAELEEARSTVASMAETIRQQAQTIAVLKAEKEARGQTAEVVASAQEDLRNQITTLRSANDTMAKEIGRLKAQIRTHGDDTTRAQLEAALDEIGALKRKLRASEEEVARLRSTQGPHTALTYDQVRKRIATTPNPRFLATADYSSGTFEAKRGQILEHRHFPLLAEYVRDGLMIVPVDDPMLTSAA